MFQSANTEFKKEISGGHVRVNLAYVPLADYYTKNWESPVSCIDMDYHFLVTIQPIVLNECFGVRSNRFVSVASIMHLVSFADCRVEDGSTLKSMRSLKIHISDPFINALNESIPSVG